MGVVTLNRAASYNLPGFGALRPGANNVPDAIISRAKRSSVVAKDIRAKVLVLSADQAEDGPESVVDDADELILLAQGDARKAEVKAARATLDEMGIDWQ